MSIALALLVPALATARSAGTVPDAHALRRAGLAVTWPVGSPAAAVAPGTRLTVAVRRLRHGAPVASVDLLQVARSGRALQRVATRRIRSGRATFTVPAGSGSHWALRLRAGRLAYTSWIDPPAAPAAAPTTTPTPPAPAPPPNPNACSATGTPSATLTLDAGFVGTGGAIGYTLTDTGTTCLTYGTPYGWQRKDGDQWVDVPSTHAFTMVAYMLHPGGTYHATAELEPSMGIGRYRLVVGYVPEPLSAPVTSGPVATAEVDVVPAGGNDAGPPPPPQG